MGIWRSIEQNLFFRSNKIFATSLWSAILFGSYVAGNSIGGPYTTQAASSDDEQLAVVVQPVATPELVAVGTPVVTPALPTSTPVPPTPVPAAPTPVPTAKPAPVKLASTQTKFVNNYAYGNCTYYVATRRPVPPSWGNAVAWYSSAARAGYAEGTAPAVGAIAWTSVGTGGLGHVAYVEQVSGSQIYISEMNFNGNFNRVTYRWVAASAFKYIY